MEYQGHNYLVTREIGIDAGHRVTFHGSKCRNIHGHRYTIQATCEGKLQDSGEEMGMVMDFGFLKEEMMNEIDAPCDHGFICWDQDKQVLDMFAGENLKLYIVPFVPTAENLARHWFERLARRVDERTEGRANLLKVKVWETPNCSAEYPGVG